MRKCPSRFLASYLTTILICFLAASRQIVLAQASLFHSNTVQSRPVNLDFEQGRIGQLPEGWDSPTTGYVAELIENQAKSGKRAALLRDVPGAGNSSPFGNLMQAIDAATLRGHRVRFRAAVRTEAGDSEVRVHLWMQVDRRGNQKGFMGNQPITPGEWQYYDVVGDVDEDAIVINIGMLLLNKGKAWLDDVSFEDLGKVEMRAEPPRPLTAHGLENLVAFTRLLGYVRHFHPSDEAADANWNAFAIKAVNEVEEAKNAADLSQRLESIFRPVAPTISVFPTAEHPTPPRELSPPANASTLRVVSWRHQGFGQKTRQNSIYKSERVWQDAPGGTLPKDSPDPRQPFSADLGGGVSCLVPLALFGDAKGTLPHAATSETKSKDDLVKYSGNDRATRLADVGLAWNILEHFYPYFDVVQTDWQQALRAALTSAANDANEKAFLITLRRMVAQLHDGHGNVYHPADSADYFIPVILKWVEGQLVISDLASAGTEGLQPGDVVLKVDGRPSASELTERESLISAATPQWRRFVALEQIRAGAKDSVVTLEVKSQSGQVRSVVLHRTIEEEALSEARPDKISELKPGIFYLDLDRIKDEDFQAVLPKLEQARGIIFDLRGYPRVSPKVILHLTEKPIESARFLLPVITTPDHAQIKFDDAGRWKLEPVAPRLTAKMAFLVDGRAISYAESWMGIIEAYKLAAIVGEPTAGTNGDINPFNLPGNYTVIWTGLKVLKHDGSQHHGIGIQPTVPVSRTIRGIRERRDEQLERAVNIVSQ